MSDLTPGQREVIALALLHGWRWHKLGPDCLPLLTNIVAGRRFCRDCDKTLYVSQFKRGATTCIYCVNLKARMKRR